MFIKFYISINNCFSTSNIQDNVTFCSTFVTKKDRFFWLILALVLFLSIVQAKNKEPNTLNSYKLGNLL